MRKNNIRTYDCNFLGYLRWFSLFLHGFKIITYTFIGNINKVSVLILDKKRLILKINNYLFNKYNNKICLL